MFGGDWAYCIAGVSSHPLYRRMRLSEPLEPVRESEPELVYGTIMPPGGVRTCGRPVAVERTEWCERESRRRVDMT